MIRVTALTSGRDTPSSRFRVRQHIEPLASSGIAVDERIPAIEKNARIPGWPRTLRQAWAGPLLLVWDALKLASRISGVVASWRGDCTWLSRELLPGLPTLEGALRGPVVLDVDDAVWLTPPLGRWTLRRIAGRAAVVVAGNRFIADWFSPHCPDVRVVPTTLDTGRFRPRRDSSAGPFTVGWTGSADNYSQLLAIERPLSRFLADHRDARLLILADRPPRLARVPPGRIDFRYWSAEEEVAAVQRMEVGLMPLPESDWARGKCSFKMIQYMACGIPSVVSPVGTNAEILDGAEVALAARNEDEWYEGLHRLCADRDLARRLGEKGRATAVARFDRRVATEQLAQVFRDVVGRPGREASGASPALSRRRRSRTAPRTRG